MTPADFLALAEFLYGPQWRGPLADDAGIRPDNLKRLMTARRGIPPALAEFLLRRTADRWLLRAYHDQPPPAGLSDQVAADLDARIGAAISWSESDGARKQGAGEEA